MKVAKRSRYHLPDTSHASRDFVVRYQQFDRYSLIRRYPTI